MIKFHILLVLLWTVCSVDTNRWDFVFADVHDIAINNSTAIMLKQSGYTTNGYPVYYWNGTNQAWTYFNGICVQVSLGHSYALCTSQVSGLNKRALPIQSNVWLGFAPGKKIKTTSSDLTWFTSLTSVTGGYALNKYQLSTSVSTPVSGSGAIDIAPTNNGGVYIVTDTYTIMKYGGGSWATMPGSARAIAAGPDDIPVILTTIVSDYGGYTVQRWNISTSSWVTLDGIGGIGLTVDYFNTPYVITSTYDVYRLKGSYSFLCPSTPFLIPIRLF